jgi:hypothetical protein
MTAPEIRALREPSTIRRVRFDRSLDGFSALSHLLRNSIDHGTEMPEARRRRLSRFFAGQ